MAGWRVFVTRCRQSFPAAAMERLEAQCQVSYWRDNSVIPKAELQAGLRGQHALLCLLTDKLDEEMLEGAGELQVVATMSVGHDHLDLAALHRRNIAVGYCSQLICGIFHSGILHCCVICASVEYSMVEYSTDEL